MFFGESTIGRYSAPDNWMPLWWILFMFLVVYWFLDSYPGISVSPVDELRSISLANVTVFLFISVMLARHGATVTSQLLCLPACICASALILATRVVVRQIGSQFDWWGYPVVLFGRGPVARLVLSKLLSQPHLGLHPVAVISDQALDERLDGVPVFQLEQLGQIATTGIRHAIVAAPELSEAEFTEVIERGRNAFPHLILIPDTDFFWKVGSYTRDLMGVMGLHVRNNLLSRASRIAKRAIDLTFSVVLILVCLPLIGITSLLIAFESGFPVFFCQERLGRGGQTFRIWKFRTMVRESALVLECCLASRPDLRKEWANNQKLRNDPRITRIGRLLRKSSLDELPQLWNILKGEMSLVGPRPIIDTEVAAYRDAFLLYAKCTPGLTGLWQVSGRNHTTYDERVAYDSYYVRNWSIWMDIYLLARTVSVVLTGDGAY
jgi:Undecaprenyl-phosphate galactose phosphotransferase WbaP